MIVCFGGVLGVWWFWCWLCGRLFYVFFFQAEDGIRVHCVTGVQTCALPIWQGSRELARDRRPGLLEPRQPHRRCPGQNQIGRASCRERVQIAEDDATTQKNKTNTERHQAIVDETEAASKPTAC